MEQILDNLAVLITRPVPQANRLASKIAELGGRFYLFPTLEIISHSAAQLKTILTAKTYLDKVIFTSANAVYPIMPFWSALRCKPEVFAIGLGTALALAEHKVIAKMPQQDFTSEGLLALPGLQSVDHSRLAIFTGRAGRNLLASQLRQRGALVRIVPVYERRCPKTLVDDYYQRWQQAGLQLIISTSSENLRNLCSVAKTPAARSWLYQQQLLVISPQMAQMAQNLGFARGALLAVNASDDAIMDVVTSYARSATHLARSIL